MSNDAVETQIDLSLGIFRIKPINRTIVYEKCALIGAITVKKEKCEQTFKKQRLEWLSHHTVYVLETTMAV